VDFKVSRKETRYQPEGKVDVVLDNICDLYPIFADDPKYAETEIVVNGKPATVSMRKNLIMDVEMIDDERAELLDRATFAMMKQRGQDPIEPYDGIPWAESVLGEFPPPALRRRIQSAVGEEGGLVTVTQDVISSGGKSYLTFKLALTSNG
jgi:hypothetical protein